MKKILNFVIMLLITSSMVFSVGDISITDIVQPTGVNPGETATASYKVSSQATGGLPTVVFFKNDLVLLGGTDKIDDGRISFTPASLSGVDTIPKSVTISVAVPEFTVPGVYQGSIESTDTGANHDAFTLNLEVLADPSFEFPNLGVTPELVINTQEDNSKSQSVQIKNTGNVVINNLQISDFTLTDDDGETTTVVFTTIPTGIQPNANSAFNFVVNVPVDFDLGKYSHVVTVSDPILSISENFRFELKIRPEVCTDGVMSGGQEGGNNLEISIKEPDNGDDFYPGGIINIDVDVKNNDDTDMDVIVEAILFNIDEAEELETVESDAQEIRDGQKETFEFDLEIPSDDLSEDDEYVLYIKAYEDGDEDQNCNEEEVNIDLKREKDNVIIKRIDLRPKTLSCDETFDVIVDVNNLGSKRQDDVFVRLIQSVLGIDLTSDTFDLRESGRSDDDETIRFNNLLIPSNAENKPYQFEAVVTFKDGDRTNSKFESLTVTGCKTIDSTDSTGDVSISLSTNSFSVNSGEAISLPVLVTNTGSSSQTYSIEITNVGSFAQIVPSKTISLNAGESSTLYFVLNTKTGLSEATYSGTINVKSGTSVLSSVGFNVEIKGKGTTYNVFSNVSDWFNSSKAFWIIGDVILVIVAIFFIKLIFSSGKKTKVKEL